MASFLRPPRWEQSEIGQRLLNAPWGSLNSCEIALFIVIREEAQFRSIMSLNLQRGSQRCLWISDDSGSESSDSTIRCHSDGDFGAIALCASDYNYEKHERQHPPCFLFGRVTKRRFADVWLGKDRQFSRSEFILAMKKGFWILRSHGSPLVVQNDTALERSMPGMALNPHTANTVKWANELGGGLKFEIYCRAPRDSGQLQWYEDYESQSVTDMSLASVSSASASAISGWEDPPNRLYIFDNPDLGVREYLALDPWTCTMYSAQKHPLSNTDFLQARVRFLKQNLGHRPTTYQESGAFMYDEDVREHRGYAYVLCPLREDYTPLRSCPHARTSTVARRIFYNLLKLVSELHSKGVYHRNLNLDTVFIADDPDLSDLVVTEFSQFSTQDREAASDCQQIFQLVYDFIEEKNVPICWLGTQYLGNLWGRFLDPKCPWVVPARDVWETLQLDSNPKFEAWETLRIVRSAHVRFMSDTKTSDLDVGDVKSYFRLATMALSPAATYNSDIFRLQTKIEVLVSKFEHKGKISVANYHVLDTYLEGKGHRYARPLADVLPESHIRGITSPLSVSLTLNVPYHSRYGLASISRLIHFGPRVEHASASMDKYRIKGPAGLNGFFVTSTSFRSLIEKDDLQCNIAESDRRDCSLDCYRLPHWSLVTANEVAQLYPVDSTGKVLLDGNATKNMGEYLQHFAAKQDYIDIASTPQLDHIGKTTDESDIASLFSSIDPSLLPFQFGRQAQPLKSGDSDLRLSTKAGISRTAQWLAGDSKRRRRMKGDIVPTRFYNG